MDFLIEFVGEILGELVLEGGVSAASDHRRPKWQRVLILTLMALFFAAVFALMAAGGIGGGVIGRKLNRQMENQSVERLFIALMAVIICVSLFNTWRYSAG